MPLTGWEEVGTSRRVLNVFASKTSSTRANNMNTHRPALRQTKRDVRNGERGLGIGIVTVMLSVTCWWKACTLCRIVGDPATYANTTRLRDFGLCTSRGHPSVQSRANSQVCKAEPTTARTPSRVNQVTMNNNKSGHHMPCSQIMIIIINQVTMCHARE